MLLRAESCGCAWTARLTSLLCTRCFSTSQLKIESANRARDGSRTLVGSATAASVAHMATLVSASLIASQGQCMRKSPVVLDRAEARARPS